MPQPAAREPVRHDEAAGARAEQERMHRHEAPRGGVASQARTAGRRARAVARGHACRAHLRQHKRRANRSRHAALRLDSGGFALDASLHWARAPTRPNLTVE